MTIVSPEWLAESFVGGTDGRPRADPVASTIARSVPHAAKTDRRTPNAPDIVMLRGTKNFGGRSPNPIPFMLRSIGARGCGAAAESEGAW